MPTNDRCPHCGALILPRENFCRQCGAALNGQAPEPAPAWRPGEVPATIEALRQYCAYNQMPLDKMRFFVGEDYKQPRAFGIYRDGDQFVVYKNKSDGSRAVRYHGPDEAHAVSELYQKLLDECHQRDIWPDGKPADYEKRQRRSRRRFILLIVCIIALFMGITALTMWHDSRVHARDGYYRSGDDFYYRYGNDWYDYYYDDWILMDSSPYVGYDDYYDDYYVGSSYVDDWGYGDFTESDAWEDIQEAERESHTSSSDYSSWDSSDTDWDSDW